MLFAAYNPVQRQRLGIKTGKLDGAEITLFQIFPINY